MSNKLAVPENITILPLPPKSPELNPVENILQFMKDYWLFNRVFKSYEDIVDHCCYAWRTLQERPERSDATAFIASRISASSGRTLRYRTLDRSMDETSHARRWLTPCCMQT